MVFAHSIMRRISERLQDIHFSLLVVNVSQWPNETEQRSVPFAAHSGEAVERDGDFYGPAVNRSVRLAARPGRSGSVRCASSCQIHHSYGGVWG